MVSTIQIENIIITILLFEDIDDGSHGGQPTVVVFLFCVTADKSCGVGSPMDIVSSHNYDSLLVEEQLPWGFGCILVNSVAGG